MACAVSIEPRGAFDLDRAWSLSDQVSVRPERFGALLYHFGTRRLSFLKSPQLSRIVRALSEVNSAREACVLAGVSEAELPAYRRALGGLAAADMIQERNRA